MRRFYLLFVFCNAFMGLTAQDHFVSLDKTNYQRNDSIHINCKIDSFLKDSVHFATLYLFIEKTDTKRSWSFRYPLIDGVTNPSLLIDSLLPEGKYAFSFQVRKSFFSIRGVTENYNDADMNYIMVTKDQNKMVNTVKTSRNGGFAVNGLLFEDSCQFVFYPDMKKVTNPVKVSLVTPLDSDFVSTYAQTHLITIGKEVPVTEEEKKYEVDFSNILGKFSLPDVVVKTTTKKKIELFNEEYSTGLFKNGDARIFDGMDNPLIGQSPGIINFLRGRVAGLTVFERNGNYILQWRGPGSFRGGSNVDVYVDEMKMDQITDNMVNPSDVAMIKAFPPPAMLSAGGQNGAIAIYTKRGEFQPDIPNRNRFKIFGYTAPEAIWK